MTQQTFILALLTLVTLGLTTGIPQATHGAPTDVLLVRQINRCRELRQARDLELTRARAAHRVRMLRLNHAQRDAQRLCEPEKSLALERIRCDRRQEVRLFHATMTDIRRSFDQAIREVRHRHAAAGHQLVPKVLACGCPIDNCRCN